MKQLRIDLKKCEAGMESCEHECESSCAEKVFKLTDPGMATLHITRNEDGSANAVLCDQCGDCVVVCPTEALKRNKLGVAAVFPDPARLQHHDQVCHPDGGKAV